MEEGLEPLAEKQEYQNISDVIPLLGGFGRFQQLVTILICMMIFPSTFTILMMYFTAQNPPYKCVSNSTTCLSNTTFESSNPYRCELARADWEFTEPKSYSIITQFDLFCEREWAVHLTTSIFFIGWAFGAVILGWVSDNYGRKIVIFPGYLTIMSVGFLASFSPNIYILIICRFILGFCLPGTAIQNLVLISELVSTKYRPHSVVFVWFFFSFALCLLSLKAYLIPNWKTLFIVCSVPYLFIMFFYKFIPESVRWLHLHGKQNELTRVLNRMKYWNKKESFDFILLPIQRIDRNVKTSPLDLFKERKLAIKTLVQGYGWLVNGMVYYGLSLAAGDLGGSIYRNFALLSAIEVPALVLTMYFCNKIGRKPTTAGSMAIGSITCLAIAFIPNEDSFKVYRVTLGIVGKCFITTSFSSIYTWSLELYSTDIRAEGIGFLQVTSRIGAASSPWIAKALKKLHHTTPFIVMGVVSLLGALLLLLLPETKDRPTRELHVQSKQDKKGLDGELCLEINGDA